MNEITQEQRDWFEGVKARSAARIEAYKKMPGTTVCELCQAVQFPDIFCTVCRTKKMCLGNDTMCCVCCEADAASFDWSKVGLIEDEGD